MNAGVSLWSACLAGAALFFTSGYLFGPRRRPALPAGDAPRSPADQGASERELALEASLAAREGRVAALQDAEAELRASLAASVRAAQGTEAQAAALGEEKRALATRLAAAERERDDARRELADARRLLATSEQERSARAREAEAHATRAREAEARAASLARGSEAQATRAAEEASERALATKAGEVDRARALEEAHRLRADLEATKASLDAAARRLADREAELGRLRPLELSHTELVMRLEALRPTADEAERLRAARADLTARLDEAERSLAARPEQRQVDELRYELGVQRQLASARQEVLARTQDENARLRAAADELDTQKRRVAELTQEVATLGAAGYLARSSHAVAPPAAAGERGSPQDLVEGLRGSAAIRSAVLADEMGFVVASHGEFAETLGAFGAFLAGAATRATAILPVGDVTEVRVRGQHDVTIAARLTPSAGSSRLVLATVEISPEKEEDRDLRARLLRTVSAMPG